MNKKTIASNMIWSLISMLISASITMLILPYVSEKIGIEAYGYIALCNNIITYVDLLASTINVYAIRFISIEYHKHNLKKANIYYSSVLVANIIIAIVLVIPSTFCVAFIDKLLDVPVQLNTDIRILFGLTLSNYVITIMGTVFSTAAFVKDILYKDAKIKAESNVIRAIVLLGLFLLLPSHVWYVTIATIVSSVFIITRNIILSKKYAPELNIKVKEFSWKAIIEIASNGVWNTVASLGIALNSGLDLLVTNLFLGATQMGQLSVSKTLSNFVSILLMAVTNSFRPQLLQFYSKDENEKLSNGFFSSMKMCGIITCVIFSVFTAIGNQFLRFWIPNQNISLIYKLTVLTFFAETFTGFVKPLNYGCVLTGKLKIPCLSNLLVGLFNVISMIIFLNITNGGLYVVAITTVVGNILYNFIIMPFYVSRILSMDAIKLCLLVLRYIFCTFTITVVLFFLMHNINIVSFIQLIFIGILSVTFAFYMYIVLMLNRREKKVLFSFLSKK